MDCGVPFCQGGNVLPAGTSGCPVYNLIPEWNDMLYKGHWQQAFKLLLKTNNFPEFTGRVCPAPCEGACVLGINEPPVTIKHHEYAIIEQAFAQGWVKPRIPGQRTGRKIAIVGSGPAGLAAADELNQYGHSVTVFERDDRPGGLLMYGIPNMKLDKRQVVDRRLKLMETEGVTFKTNTEVGRHISLQELQQQYDALILATGATVPRDLAVPGRELKGIHFAMELLTRSTKDLLTPQATAGSCLNAKGKKVVVIGGGDTGTDCVATVLRQQCAAVLQLEIMPKPPVTRAADNPWPEYPRLYKADYGQQEAAARFGRDPRLYEVMTRKFLGNNGRLTGLVTTKVKWLKKNGHPVPAALPDTGATLEADMVLLAMGFTGPEPQMLQLAGIALSRQGHIKATYGNYATNQPGVFAAGDCRRGQSLVVWAINEGRGAARACHQYLQAPNRKNSTDKVD